VVATNMKAACPYSSNELAKFTSTQLPNGIFGHPKRNKQ
jgi:hypothetical protein